MEWAGRRGASFSEYWARLKGRIDAELEAHVGEWFPGVPAAHLEALRAIPADGKRLRGSLTCLVAEALGGRIESALPAALAIEIIHAASLVHDDFVDGDTLRHGRPAPWTVLTPRRAVLLADVMFATAIEKMAEAGPAEAATLAHAIATMARGAFQEMVDPSELERRVAAGISGPDAYPRIIHLKTGSLFAAAARLGALAAGAPQLQVEAAHEFGARTGQAYQVADDLAEVALLCERPELAWPRLPALAPALLYFAWTPRLPPLNVASGGEAAFREWFADAAAGVRLRMEEEIAVLAERARAALAPFHDNEHARLLGEAPAEFVRMMAAA